jgi:hypothetical protein
MRTIVELIALFLVTWISIKKYWSGKQVFILLTSICYPSQAKLCYFKQNSCWRTKKTRWTFVLVFCSKYIDSIKIIYSRCPSNNSRNTL